MNEQHDHRRRYLTAEQIEAVEHALQERIEMDLSESGHKSLVPSALDGLHAWLSAPDRNAENARRDALWERWHVEATESIRRNGYRAYAGSALAAGCSTIEADSVARHMLALEEGYCREQSEQKSGEHG